MSEHYILEGKKVVSCDLMTWARWFESAERHVVKSGDKSSVWVSTVFIGLDHSFGDGPPLLFETMIFGGPHDQYKERCSTWEQAEEMHKTAYELAFGDKP